MAMETIIMSRHDYFHVMSRQDRPKQIRMTKIQNRNHVETEKIVYSIWCDVTVVRGVVGLQQGRRSINITTNETQR